jgi:type VII secretion integral membrane protein EccD
VVKTDYSRVTVVNGARRVDLSLPSAVPLADVLPQLLGFCVPQVRPEQPAAWTLARVGGASLSLDTSLGEAGVADGDVLELRAAGAAVQPAYVEDVRDAVEDAIDSAGRQWRPATTVQFAVLAGAAGLAATALLPQALPATAGGALAALLVAVLAAVGAVWSAGRELPVAAHAALATATLWAGVAGWLSARVFGAPATVGLASAAVVALAVTAAARAATELAGGHLAAVAVLGAAGAVAALAYSPATAIRLDAVLAVLAVGVLPRISISTGGVAAADYQVRAGGLVGADELARRIRHSAALLQGGIVATAAVGALAGALLALADAGWDRWLGACVGAALLLRSRAFSRIPHIVPLRLAGLVVLLAAAVRLVRQTAGLHPWTVVLAATAASAAVAASAVPLSDVVRARVKQTLNGLELLVVIAMVAAAAAALGLFGWVADMSH